jgi:hypothetical protein
VAYGARTEQHDQEHGGPRPEHAAPSAIARSRPSGAVSIADVQRLAGNRTTVALLGLGQAKLQVGDAADTLEVEADRVARQVVDLLSTDPTGADQATASPGALDEVDPPLRRRPSDTGMPMGASGGTLDGESERLIESARSGGTPLPSPVKERMEGAFGADFDNVRLHAGSDAVELNRRVSAEAFTIGSDIFFSGGLPNTTGTDGQRLLAHELTHTLQQGASSARQGRRRLAPGPQPST